MKTHTLSILLFASTVVLAQETELTESIYMLSNGHPCTKREAEFIRHYRYETDSTIFYRDYTLQGLLKEEGHALLVFPKGTGLVQPDISNPSLSMKRHGEATSYFLNGHPAFRGTYNFDELVGTSQSWYRNGMEQTKVEYTGPKKHSMDWNYKIISYYDSLGTQHVTEGNGVFQRRQEKHLLDSGRVVNGYREGEWIGSEPLMNVEFYEVFRKGTLLSGKSWTKKGDTAYYSVDFDMGQYLVLNATLMRHVSGNFEYPENARRKGIQGRVLVSFVVEKDGSLSNFEVIRKVDKELDAEALRVIKTCKKVPAILKRGRPIRIQYVLPIACKLQ